MNKPFKKFVVVKYDCKDYANRLWNDMAVYAMGLELNAKVRFAPWIERIPPLRPFYELWAQFSGRILRRHGSLWAWGGTIRYLPPSEPLNPKYDRFQSLHLLGMLFRNPVGFTKFSNELKAKFKPGSWVHGAIHHKLGRLKGRTLIAVHIRQKPFTYFPEGEFLIPLSRTKEIVDEYLQEDNLTQDTVGLIVVSDKPVPKNLFLGYESIHSFDHESFGFHLLTHAQIVIGTNSSASNLAAWFADAPHIVTSTDPIDWDYYRGHTSFFENKYASLTQKVVLASTARK